MATYNHNMSRLVIRSCWRYPVPLFHHPTTTSSCALRSWRFSSSTSPPSNDTPSGRSAFNQTPVHPSILQYIQAVGVGKAERTKRRKYKKNKGEARFFSRSEEQERFGSKRRSTSTVPPTPFPAPALGANERSESRKLIRRFPVKLLGTVGSVNEAFPKASPNLPEVAIAGRSNAGKSTLLNALLHGSSPVEEDEQKGATRPHHFYTRPKATSRTAKLPKGLKAITSAKPGETRVISFYQLSAKVDETKVSLVLVDLPGYGFAFASEEKAKEWQTLMKSYILGRGKPLKRILLLIDSRHGMKKADLEFLESLQTALLDTSSISTDEGKDSSLNTKTKKTKRELPPIQLVLTKCDLVSQSDLARRVALVRQELSHSLRRQPSSLPIMLVSAQMEGQAGVLELQKELAALAPT